MIDEILASSLPLKSHPETIRQVIQPKQRGLVLYLLAKQAVSSQKDKADLVDPEGNGTGKAYESLKGKEQTIADSVTASILDANKKKEIQTKLFTDGKGTYLPFRLLLAQKVAQHFPQDTLKAYLQIIDLLGNKNPLETLLDIAALLFPPQEGQPELDTDELGKKIKTDLFLDRLLSRLSSTTPEGIEKIEKEDDREFLRRKLERIEQLMPRQRERLAKALLKENQNQRIIQALNERLRVFEKEKVAAPSVESLVEELLKEQPLPTATPLSVSLPSASVPTPLTSPPIEKQVTQQVVETVDPMRQLYLGKFHLDDAVKGSETLAQMTKDHELTYGEQSMLLAACIEQYGDGQTIPDAIADKMQSIFGSRLIESGKINNAEMVRILTEGYKGQKENLVKVASIEASRVLPLSEDVITPADRKRFTEMKTDARSALQKLREIKSKEIQEMKADLAQKAERLFTEDDLVKMFPNLLDKWGSMGIFNEHKRYINKKGALKALCSSWGRLDHETRYRLIDLHQKGRLDNRFIYATVWGSMVPQQREENVSYPSTTFFDLIDTVTNEGSLANYSSKDDRFERTEYYKTLLYGLEWLGKDSRETTGLGRGFDTLYKIIKRELDSGKNEYQAWWQAKKELGNSWEEMKNIGRAIIFLKQFSTSYHLGNVEHTEKSDQLPNLTTIGMQNPVVLQMRGANSRPYGSPRDPFVVDENVCYLGNGANNEGKSRLAQAMVAALMEFPVFIGIPKGKYQVERAGSVTINRRKELLSPQPLFVQVPHENLSLFQGIVADTFETVLAGHGAYDEPARGSSPNHEKAISVGVMGVDLPQSLITHSQLEEYALLKTLDPETAAKIVPLFVSEHQPHKNRLALSSGGLLLLASLGLPPECLEALTHAAQRVGVENFKIPPEYFTIGRYLEKNKSVQQGFINQKDLEKIGLGSSNGAIFKLMIDLMAEKMMRDRLPFGRTGEELVYKAQESTPEFMTAGIHDKEGVSRREALMKIFLNTTGDVEELMKNPYINKLIHSSPPEFKRRITDFLRSDLNKHLRNFVVIGSLSDVMLGTEYTAVKMLDDLSRFRSNEKEFNEYVAAAQGSGFFSEASKTFFGKSYQAVLSFKTFGGTEAKTHSDAINKSFREDIKIAALEKLKNLAQRITFTDDELKAYDRYKKAVEQFETAAAEERAIIERFKGQEKKTKTDIFIESFFSGIEPKTREKLEDLLKEIRKQTSLSRTNYDISEETVALLKSAFEGRKNWSFSDVPKQLKYAYYCLSEWAGSELLSSDGEGYNTVHNNLMYFFDLEAERVNKKNLDSISLRNKLTKKDAAILAGRLGVVLNACLFRKRDAQQLSVHESLKTLDAMVQHPEQMQNTVADQIDAVTQRRKEAYYAQEEATRLLGAASKGTHSVMARKGLIKKIEELKGETIEYKALEEFGKEALPLIDKDEWTLQTKKDFENLMKLYRTTDMLLWPNLFLIVNEDIKSQNAKEKNKIGQLSQNAKISDLVRTTSQLFTGVGRELCERYVAKAAQVRLAPIYSGMNQDQHQEVNHQVLETVSLLSYANLLSQLNIWTSGVQGDRLEIKDGINLQLLARLQEKYKAQHEYQVLPRLHKAFNEYVPLNVDSDGKKIMAVSGANGDGKSTARDTIAQLLCLSKWTNIVPAGKFVSQPLDAVFMVESEGTGLDASAYTESAIAIRDLAWLAYLLKDKMFMVLGDEILAGTSEKEGRAGVEGIVEYISKVLGGYFYIISHDKQMIDDISSPTIGLSVANFGFFGGHKMQKTQEYTDPQSFRVMREVAKSRLKRNDKDTEVEKLVDQMVDFFEYTHSMVTKAKGHYVIAPAEVQVN